MSVLDLPPQDHGYPPGTTASAVDERFGRECLALLEHEDVDAHTVTDSLDRVHVVTVMKRTAPTKAPYTARIRWSWNETKRIDVHLHTSDGVIEWAEKDIAEQAIADARKTFGEAATPGAVSLGTLDGPAMEAAHGCADDEGDKAGTEQRPDRFEQE